MDIIRKHMNDGIYIPLWYLLIVEIDDQEGEVEEIYIPLWYLLIDESDHAVKIADMHLHSTMVSINRSAKRKHDSVDFIYIPLWYLLIR